MNRHLQSISNFSENQQAADQGLPTFERLATLCEPTISVSTKRVGDTIKISVADNGNGIPQKVLDKIFQPFFTTKPTGKQKDWVYHWRMIL
jgi:signal transduction histidine kinase